MMAEAVSVRQSFRISQPTTLFKTRAPRSRLAGSDQEISVTLTPSQELLIDNEKSPSVDLAKWRRKG